MSARKKLLTGLAVGAIATGGVAAVNQIESGKPVQAAGALGTGLGVAAAALTSGKSKDDRYLRYEQALASSNLEEIDQAISLAEDSGDDPTILHEHRAEVEREGGG